MLDYIFKTIILQELRFVWHDSEVHEVIQRLEIREEKLQLIRTSHQLAEEQESPKSKRTRQAIKQKKATQMLPENLRNSQEYEEEQPTMARTNTSIGENLRNSQEYEDINDNRRPGDDDSMTRGVHEHKMHTALPTELTATKKKVDKEGLMVLEYGSHQNLQSKYT